VEAALAADVSCSCGADGEEWEPREKTHCDGS
jgi:hypothetical protein